MTWRVVRGDCVEQMATMEPGSVDAVVCDPPYGLSFMSKAWDRIDGEPVDPAFLHWFAGFTDGEGCFSVHKKNVNGYETYDCQFSISLRADDRPILERIQRTLGMGTLSSKAAHRTADRTRPGANPQARYSISRKADCLRLRELFQGFPLRAKKAKDLELWSDALDAWVEHEPGEGWDDVAEARNLLMASRAYAEEGIRVDPFQMWCWRWGREALRVLKPGGHCLAMGGTRTYHRLTAGLEDAGFEIRDCLSYLYGSGFSKSWNFKTMYQGDWCSCENADPYDHSEAEHDLPRMRDGDVQEAAGTSGGEGSLLHEGVSELGAPPHGQAHGQPVDDGRAQPGVARRDLHRTRQGLSNDSDAGTPKGTSERVRAGAPAGGREDAGPPAQSGRGGPPPQRGQGGQPAGELADIRDAPRTLDDGALRNGGCCSRCGGLSQHYQGAGSGLKPAHEPIVVARKPLSGTLARTIEEYGTGALNVDGCRVGMSDEDRQTIENMGGFGRPEGHVPNSVYGAYGPNPGPPKAHDAGRWPPNVLLSHNGPDVNGEGGCVRVGTRRVKRNVPMDRQQYREGLFGSPSDSTTSADETTDAYECVPGCPVRLLDEQTGERPHSYRESRDHQGGLLGWQAGNGEGYADAGGASRFFPTFEDTRFRYVAKAGRAERNAGLDGFEEQHADFGGGGRPGAGFNEVVHGAAPQHRNVHPTVKPIELMRWLVRLVTPPGGTVLDCFAGSGSTGCAAALEGFDFIGIEREPEYVDIAEARIGWWFKHRGDGLAAEVLAAGEARDAVEATGQLELDW